MELELLAPAGSYDTAVSAIRAGANAVYLGTKQLNARRGAKNLEQSELSEICTYAHERGAKIHLTLNTMVMEEELPAVAEVIRNACEAGVDALIVQDLAVARLARDMAPSLRLHASTQMSIHNISGVRQLEQLGFSRVVLSREMSREEIRAVARETEMELEVFVHGALCMCVSGQCYFSAMLGERSGNRGLCAQPCRLPFYVRDKERYNLSLKDMSLVSHLEELQGLGVTSAKIEGRMKRPEYVVAAVHACRQALRGERPDVETLRAVFSRSGFTDGYYTAHRGEGMFGIRQKEDVVSASAGLLGELAHRVEHETPLVPVDMALTARAGQPIRIVVQDRDGHTIELQGDVPETAINRPTTPERAAQSLGKTGGTPYFIEDTQIDLDEGLLLPAAALNALRREALEGLHTLRSAPRELPCGPAPERKAPAAPAVTEPRFRARLFRRAQLDAISTGDFEQIILPLDELFKLDGLEHREDRGKFAAELPRAIFSREKTVLEQLTELRRRGVQQAVCSNLGAVTLAQQAGMSACGGFGLNAANSVSVSELAALGLADVTLSLELPLVKLRQISSPIPKGILAYGNLPLMLTRNCPVKQEIGCKDCGGCSQLTDRKGIRFPVQCTSSTEGEAVEVLNSLPLYLADRLREFAGFAFLTLYFTTETPAQVSQVVKDYQTGAARDGITRGLYYRNLL